MVERTRVTLLYSYDDNWIGGTYYILNIIKGLNTLPDHLKPQLLILHNSKSKTSSISEIGYPYINLQESDFKFSVFERVVNKASRLLTGRLFYKLKLPTEIRRNVYPLPHLVDNAGLTNSFYWIPDLQEYYLTSFFSSRELNERKSIHKEYVAKQSPIVFSSQAAADDFNKFYPGNKNEQHILNFASFIDADYLQIPIEQLKAKFGIVKPYFIVSNQFWKHKNHFVVLKALKLLSASQDKFQLVFTGKESDYRHPEYFAEITAFIKDNNLASSVLSLGFIDRSEQLQLMANSIAIVQPSLFEGWSTVVEDAKVLNKYILVSDIPIHREQITGNAVFFDPNSPDDLAAHMQKALDNGVQIDSRDYSDNQQKFGLNLIKLFK
jgi:glycosyltransferase involved in cell wall biosynthesis